MFSCQKLNLRTGFHHSTRSEKTCWKARWEQQIRGWEAASAARSSSQDSHKQLLRRQDRRWGRRRPLDHRLELLQRADLPQAAGSLPKSSPRVADGRIQRDTDVRIGQKNVAKCLQASDVPWRSPRLFPVGALLCKRISIVKHLCTHTLI